MQDRLGKEGQRTVAKQKKPDEKKSDGRTSQTVSIPYLKIILCLFCICTVCAGLLGATFLLTKEPIAVNEKNTIDLKLVSIYGEEAVFDYDTPVPEGQSAEAVYIAKNQDNAVIGYAVRVLSRGFSDDIDLIVGFNADRSIRKVEIVALSETAGLGSLVQEEDYLAQYGGKSGELVLKEDIDAISGATRSSRAVLDGVNLAGKCLTALGV